MLTSLHITNFKAWKNTGPIRLAPLTVIFGANSAGKSSLGHLLLAEELRKAFPKAEDLVAGMKIHKFYKDVTYETLKNKDFGERVMKEIPQSVLDGSLLQGEVVAKSGAVMS